MLCELRITPRPRCQSEPSARPSWARLRLGAKGPLKILQAEGGNRGVAGWMHPLALQRRQCRSRPLSVTALSACRVSTQYVDILIFLRIARLRTHRTSCTE